MSTYQLGTELSQLFLQATFEEPLSEAQEARWLRVARELARRDYRFREHGRECVCGDCWHLFETWAKAQRRGEPSTQDFVPNE